MKRIISFFLPKESAFFDFLSREAENAGRTCRALLSLVDDYSRLSYEQKAERVETIRELEHKGDDINREVVESLHTTFLTPIDPEDIHGLASLLDDVTDLTANIGKKLLHYRVKNVPISLKTQLHIACEQIYEIEKAIHRVKKGEKIGEERTKIFKLERKADEIHFREMENLFVNVSDNAEVIKLKDLYETAEELTDKAKGIATLLDAVVMKNA